ncbi:hypothetical protein [Sphingobacterium sp. CZ-UAM]|uniref:hypothetical protein n=1 Tax=Sphingobacterium sp. CZ-UAM TaxID=1933868 RepID=UPI00158E48AF|nr:hypothetical protein [Sphingobacterium sp. CZ-UAM]
MKQNKVTIRIKDPYLSPQLQVVEIEMEQGIAAGSGTVNTGTVSSSWENGTDTSGEMDW